MSDTPEIPRYAIERNPDGNRPFMDKSVNGHWVHYDEHLIRISRLENQLHNAEELIDLLQRAEPEVTDEMVEAGAIAHFEDQHRELYDALSKSGHIDGPYKKADWNEIETASLGMDISWQEWHRRKARAVLVAALAARKP